MRGESPVTGARRASEADFQDTEAYRQGREVLNGTRLSGEATLQLARALRNELAYKLAREVAAITRPREDVSDEFKYQLLRVQVTCTYIDPELPAEESLPLALKTLADAGYPETTSNPEMLGLAGAIHRRWWEHDGQRRHLDDSLRLYRRAYGTDVTTDNGYQAINAAFVLDLLASLETGSESAAWEVWHKEALAIREELIEKLPQLPGNDQDWWYQVTLVEALFGARRYEEAVERLRRASELKPQLWQLQSTTLQLAKIARLQQRGGKELLETSPAWQALQDSLGETWAARLRSSFIGKVGLALSGGGFRASLYHIGVLARLAELDLLRHVEVLSCVSGGSIIGAYLYLELRHLLQTRADSEITRQDYVELVERIERSFLEGVQTNLRTRLLAEPLTAMRDALFKSYSQTERVGELFEEHLYSRVEDGEQTGKRWLNRLYIEPQPEAGEAPSDLPFNPRVRNWQRSAKVPILILNATTLNTGHSWQFTASDLGEPPGRRSGIETNPLLSRLRYQDTPERYRCFPLGHAVAASAAVPGLFGPLVMEDLFQNLRLRLADGGVFDNQGIASLLDRDCTVLLVSDASGQLPVVEDPGGGRIAVPVRANDVLMARVREIQHRVLIGRRDASLLRGLVYVHLKQDLEAEPIDSVGAPEPSRAHGARGALTSYGVRRDVQARLASLRTDLDAFSDFEAWSLMESGYRAITEQFASCLSDVPVSQEPPAPWRFHAVAPLITRVDRPQTDYDALCDLLKVGQLIFFKLPALRPWMRRAGAVLGFLAALAVAAYAVWEWDRVRTVLGVAAAALVIGISGALALRGLKGMFAGPPSSPRKSFLQRLGAFGVGLATVVPSVLYLAFGNRLYLQDGQVPQEGLPLGARRLRRR
jgi:predicted acylesterase/phospholipase RssA